MKPYRLNYSHYNSIIDEQRNELIAWGTSRYRIGDFKSGEASIEFPDNIRTPHAREQFIINQLMETNFAFYLWMQDNKLE